MEYLDSSFKTAIKQDDFASMINAIEADVTQFYSEFNDTPAELSGWGHNWFCPNDGGRLIFDAHKPYEHVCEICGKAHNTPLFHTVWVYNYRMEAFVTMFKSAIAYKATENKQYLTIFKELFSFYMDNYDSFVLHDKTGAQFDSLKNAPWGCARIMPQSLNESVAFVRATQALEILKNDLDSVFLKRVKEELFPKLFSLLKPQVDKIHNIPCWLNSAIGVMGLFAQNKEMIDFVFLGEFNINRQLQEGVTKDNFWYEGSIHYNFFTLEGVLPLLLFAQIYNHPFEQKETLKKMLEAGFYYAFDSYQLPNPNDGWPNINLKTYSYLYALGVKIFNDDTIKKMYGCILNAPIERTQVPIGRPYYYKNKFPLEHLALITSFMPDKTCRINRKSTLYPHSNYAMLRNEHYNIFCKFGHNGPSHAHPDKMNIEVIADGKSLSRDLSNSGYGAALCNEWHRTTISHNTVCVNGQNQISFEQGKVLNFTDNSCTVFAQGIYTNHKTEYIKDLKESLNPDELLLYICRNLNVNEDEAKKIAQKGGSITVNAGDNQVDFERTLTINAKIFTDSFKVTCEKKSTIDWFFHCEAQLLTKLSAKPAETGFNKNGYQHLKNVELVSVSKNEAVLEWDLHGSKICCTLQLNGAEFFMCDSLDNPVVTSRKAIMLRAQNALEHTFAVTWNL